jgi:hypothetical protein
LGQREVSWVWWYMPVILALGLRQEVHEFKASQGYIVRCCLKYTHTETDTHGKG